MSGAGIGTRIARCALSLALICIAPTAFAIDKIVVVGLFKDRAVVSIDGRQHVLSAGMTSPEGVTLISADSREAVLEVDGIRTAYALGAHIGSQYKKREAPSTVTVAPDLQGMYLVNGNINGFQVDFVVDTGATYIAMNRHQAKRLGLDYKLEGRQALSSTAAGITKVYLVNLDKVRIGDIEIRNVPGAVHDGDHPAIILLGNSFLNQLNLSREGDMLQLMQK
ncbi:MAG: TIGR02281 family clan AA aspartic protease [Gammaproteobacteria bacterium]|nr:TIGR02281 family clan AA aspartic protease [Gammaproteobacteria bacterium]